MDRRTLLKYSFLGIGAGVLNASLQSIVKAGETESSHWGYIGEEGPEFWSELSPDFQVCAMGDYQSPIDLDSSIPADLGELEISYQDSPLKLINNGHTIQVNYEPGSFLKLDGQDYELLQFHFHKPSEHLVEGSPFDMEAHLVHKHHATGNLAVLGVFMKRGADNQALRSIWEKMPRSAGPEETVRGVSVNASQLLPEDRNGFYRYYGSLTTPPCSEIVNWIVFKQPIEVSADQIVQFIEAAGVNARPAMPRNRRFVLSGG